MKPELLEKLKTILQGETDTSSETREFYSHDASLFEVKPEAVVFPKDSTDVQALVKFVANHKAENPRLAITPRSGGTCMSGGAVGESIVMDMNRHFTKIHNISPTEGHTQPGVFYRNFDAETLKQNVLMPTYPASREICTVGGMVNNNSGGEKSLEYGKTEDFVLELKVVLADGNEYIVRPLSQLELEAKMAEKRSRDESTSRFTSSSKPTTTKSKPLNQTSQKTQWATTYGMCGTVIPAFSTSASCLWARKAHSASLPI